MSAHCFKVVFSKRLGQSVPVSLACLMCLPVWAQPAPTALPSGSRVTAGEVSVSSNGASMAIRQSSDRAAIQWQSFNIGKDSAVVVQQPSSQSVLLNRVTGESPSQIFGQLSANGQVVLINPSGVTFGKDGSVSAAGFTASTLGMADADFMAGNMRFARNGGTAGIVNQGRIRSAGGYVALLGARVSNEGRIETQGGAALLGAAEAIQLPLSATGRVKLELTPAQINASVANTQEGVIVTEGGQVYLQAGAVNTALASVLHSGQIDTSGAQGGAVHVLADGGHIKVDGRITANSSQAGKQGGEIVIGRDLQTGVLAQTTDVSGARLESQRGFVETSGQWLKTEGIQVKAGEWLLDPVNVEINSTGTATTAGNSAVKASDIASALTAGTSVTIATGSGTGSTSSMNPAAPSWAEGSVQADGNIDVNADILSNYTGASLPTLTLTANNGIAVNNQIKAQTGSLNVTMTANGLGTTSKGISIFNTVIDGGTSGNISLTGTSTSKGIYIKDDTANAGIKGHNVTLNGTAKAAAATTGQGVYFDIFSGSTGSVTGQKLTVDASNDLNITGTLSGAGVGSGVFVNNTWTGNTTAPGAALLMTAGGNAAIKGVQTGNAGNTSNAVYLTGLRLSTTGNASILAEAASSNSIAIYLKRNDGTLRFYDDNWRMQVRSSGGHVLIQSNQGSILAQDLAANPNISGRNVIIDNTGAGMTIGGVANANGGSIDTSTGAITLGSGTSTYSATANGWNGSSWVPMGVSLGGATGDSLAGITSSGNVTIGSSSSAAAGINVVNASSITGNINLSGRSTNASASGVNIQAAITSTSGNINITASSTSGSKASANLASGGSLVTNAAGKSITINADTLQIDTSATPASINAGSSGTVNIRPVASGVGIDLGGNDVMTSGNNVLGLSNTELARITAGQLNIGSATAGSMTVSSAVTTPDAAGHLALITGGNLAINAALQTGTTGTKNLTLNLAGSGSATESASASIKTSNLELLGSNASFTLNNTANDASTLAANVKSLSYTDATALTIGSVNSTSGITASGTVAVATQSGDLSVTQAISSGDTTSSAIVLNAGQSSAAGTASGGDILLSDAHSFSTGTGGRTTLYTCNTSNANLSSLVGSGSGRFRYNSDERTTNYTAVLGSGLYAIYREQPIITVQVDSVSKTYDSQAFSGGSLASTPSAGSLLNGDSFAGVTANAQLGGSAQGAKNASTTPYSITASDNGGTSALGYGIAYTPGQLTIHKAALTVTGNRLSRTYNGQTQSVSGYTVSGLQGSDTTADLSNVSASGASGRNAGSYANTVSAGTQTNYDVTTIDGALTISKATASVSGTATSLTYNGATQTQTAPTSSGFIAGDNITISGAASGKNAGTYTSALQVTGSDAANYDVTVTNADLVIGKAALTVTGNSLSSTYNGQTQSVSGYTVSGLQGSDTAADLNNVSASGASGRNAGSYANTVSAGTQTNYEVTLQHGSLQIDKVAASVSGTATQLTYNGQTQNQSAASSNGFIAGDSITISGAASGKNAGTYSSALQVGGSDASNYNIAINNADLNIAKAALTVTGNSLTSTYNGQTQSVSGYTVSGLQGSDTAADLNNVSASGASGRNAGSYANTVSAGTQTNYEVTLQHGSLQIEAVKPDPLPQSTRLPVAYKPDPRLPAPQVSRLSLAGFGNTGAAVGQVGHRQHLIKVGAAASLQACSNDSASKDCVCEDTAQTGVEICQVSAAHPEDKQR